MAETGKKREAAAAPNDTATRLSRGMEAVNSVIGASARILALGVAVWLVVWHSQPVRLWLFSVTEIAAFGVQIKRAQLDDALRTLSQPNGQAAAEALVLRAQRVAPVLQGARILWVDDTPSRVGDQRSALEALGIRVDIAASSDEAVGLVQRGQVYDLLISDVARPSDIANANAARDRPTAQVERSVAIQCLTLRFREFGEQTGTLADLPSVETLVSINATREAGFALLERLVQVDSRFADRLKPRAIFYGGFATDYTNECARLITDDPIRLLHGVVSALEELRWERLRR